MTFITSRNPKGPQIAHLFDATLNKVKLDHERSQPPIENDGEFQDGLEMESRHGYRSGYSHPKPLDQQIKLLRDFFAIISDGYKKEAANQLLPPQAEGWFAIPRWEKIAKSYPEAVQVMLDTIKKIHNGRFHNWRDGQIDEKHIRQLAESANLQKRLGKEQEGYDILVVPCQFGLRHRGRSVRRAREVMNLSEFGLGAFAIGMMLLTHEDRLRHYDDLWIDCAGDEFSNEGDERFGRAPCFHFCDDEIKFGASWCDGADRHYGSASAFLPSTIGTFDSVVA